ncbi:MAG: hypothetical protein KF768_10490 [Phycisphaeraceae bacterium]|nr:hypothetical protein [Phycisphaeraceae bacterium]
MAKSTTITDEFKAIQTALEVLEPLDETQRKFALSMILARLGLSGGTLQQSASGGGGGGGGNSGGAAGGAGSGQLDLSNMTAKQFLAAKKPTTDAERFVCLAYYLTHARNSAQFKTKDITDLNGEAFGGRFSNPAMTANNAVNQSRLLAPAGSGKRRITLLGEQLVEALPDREAVEQVRSGARQPAKKRGGKKKAKKARAAT